MSAQSAQIQQLSSIHKLTQNYSMEQAAKNLKMNSHLTDSL